MKKSAGRHEKWWALGMLWLVCFFNYADRQAIGSLFPLLEKDFGFTKAQLGLIGSAFMVVYALASPIAGYAGDRFSRKGLLVGGCLLWSLMTGLTGWCSLLWQFVAVRGMIGLGESVYFPSATSLLSDYHVRTRSTALSLHQSAVYIGTIAGGWIAALVAQHYGWRSSFYAFGVTGVLAALCVAIFLREPARDPQINRKLETGLCQTLLDLVRVPSVPFLLLAFACANAVGAIFLVWAPTFLYEKFHLGLVEAGFSAVAAIQLASAVSAPLSGILADRLAGRFRGARMVVQAVALFLGGFCVMAVGYAPTTGLLLAAMLCFGFCKGGYDGGIFASVFDLVPPSRRASTAGLMNLIGWGGGALGPLLVGWYCSLGSGTAMERMSAAISVSGFVYFAAAALVLGALRARRIGDSV